jgi:1-acyl-sn-glycerol-3-phosphate acyltransferase
MAYLTPTVEGKAMKRFLRIVMFTASLYVVTHIVAFSILPVGLILGALGRMSELQRLKLGFAKTVFWIVGQKSRVSGLQHLDPQARYLIVSNYPSGYALFALIMLFPNASFVAHEFISRIPLLGQVMRQSGTIFVNGKYPIKAYCEIDLALERGVSSDLIILPEGRRSPDGEVHHFKRGFVHILRCSDLDLLPVTLNGFYKLKPANRIYLDPDTDLGVLIHDPISRGTIKEMSDTELIGAVECTIKGQYRP